MEYTEGMPADEVVAIIDFIEASEIVYQVNGGWAVDALVGHQTRSHQDIDLFVDGARFEDVIEWLEARGYQMLADYMPVSMDMVKDDMKADVHPMVLDDDGNGHQAGEKADYFFHPIDKRTTGTIGGRSVVVGNIDHLEHLHKGYAPRDVDLHDLMELAKLRAPKLTPIDLQFPSDSQE